MNVEYVSQLFRECHGKTVMVHVGHNRFIGKWYLIDVDVKVIGVRRKDDSYIIIDMGRIEAIEYNEGKNVQATLCEL